MALPLVAGRTDLRRILAAPSLLTAAAAGLAAGLAGPHLPRNEDVYLVLAIAITAAGPIAWRMALGRFDPFEPVVVSGLALLLLFVARPIYDIAVADYTYLGRNLRGPYTVALLAVLVAAVAFQTAYHSPIPRAVARRLPAPPSNVHTPTAIAMAVSLTTVSAAFLTSFAVQRGGFGTLLANRGAGLEAAVPITTEGIFFGLPAVLLLVTQRSRSRGGLLALALIPLALLLARALPGGDRRLLLAILLPLGMLPYLSRRRRPPVALLAVAFTILLVVVVTPARAARRGDAPLGEALLASLSNPLASAGQLLQVDDTSVIDALALLVDAYGGALPFRHGQESLNNTVLLPIPGELWPGKPEKTRTLVIDHYWGTDRGACLDRCPTFSMVGDLYSDLGLVSVALGAAALGATFATAYRYFRLHEASALVQAGYSALLWLSFLAWWDSTGIVVAHAASWLAPLIVVGVLSRRAARSGRPDPT